MQSVIEPSDHPDIDSDLEGEEDSQDGMEISHNFQEALRMLDQLQVFMQYNLQCFTKRKIELEVQNIYPFHQECSKVLGNVFMDY